ncbi:flagellar hook capping protein FlgD [Clostridium pasteurianum DSM 525 = ATCC 6013]|uniref:Flagellar hook capping protein n=1 Tax=Clostridium pasteurianum DSM 525 = ATCC 6013 TaxID=1262449 RepID=A0A0H3J1W0_CLOPA|nr:flagellar hook capping FlgD N-terminal domain-containing protein [Clostridium pasteurianum]AJA47891.1 flagellar hook capping protein FlgD [Clostridium pasteurianum DSM 525 = ATCC 6013]AJA51879.1 flagellar hook capping protein FlgD [Clostridium pasteurianum DSM 525 = ATCC 6013]AOZ75181.1 flagellar hook capping protein [Clostridium pasteurianum DSM 525 = ATCC 6013]AOZ78976.1 flagellar hook capping protein [Clostridium pasteurianum]ELP59794.1 flagellar hook capping protein [Clostridium pasteur
MAVTNNNTPILTGYKSNVTSSGKTDKGTPIVKKGQEIDKNSFLKILSAELSNQDPTSSSNQDSTQYVAQLAQFSSLEQMSNLNSTMTLNSASNLIGVPVEFNSLNSLGNNYVGIVKSVTRNGDSIALSVATSDNGKAIDKDFDYGDILQINPEISTDNSSSDSSNSDSENTTDTINTSDSNESTNLSDTNSTTDDVKL